MTMPGRTFQAGITSYRYGFNGKEKDNEVKGEGNTYDFGARILDPRIGRWFSVDPLQRKYPDIAPYVAFGNNPISIIDPDGKDIVYFNSDGVEYRRVESKTQFITYVDVTFKVEYFNPHFDAKSNSWQIFESRTVTSQVKVPMPKIITEKLSSKAGKDGTYSTVKIESSPENQRLDYQIAATTFLFNQKKNSTQFYTDGGNAIPMSRNSEIQNLDPTLLKAMAFQESDLKKGVSDVLTVNATGDWGSWKAKYGLTKGVVVTPATSVNTAPFILVTKGFKVGEGEKGGVGLGYPWLGGIGNMNAAKKYNGGGVENYKESTQKMLDTSRDPTPADYNPKLPKK